jgi:hypothetical protein
MQMQFAMSFLYLAGNRYRVEAQAETRYMLVQATACTIIKKKERILK